MIGDNMTEYKTIASRFGGSQLVVALEKPKEITIDFKGFLYDREQNILTPVEAEVFKFGYWEESDGEIELDNDRKAAKG
jgi:hypothetical protein